MRYAWAPRARVAGRPRILSHVTMGGDWVRVHWSTRPQFNHARMATSESEVESLENLLESAGQRALTEHELSEAKRILYGNPAQ